MDYSFENTHKLLDLVIKLGSNEAAPTIDQEAFETVGSR